MDSGPHAHSRGRWSNGSQDAATATAVAPTSQAHRPVGTTRTLAPHTKTNAAHGSISPLTGDGATIPVDTSPMLGRLALRLCLLCVLACSCLVCMPWRLIPFRMGLDESWHMVLSHAAANGMAFGHELAFTQGPYAFLLAGIYHPQTYGYVLLLRGFIALVLLGCGWQMARQGVVTYGLAVIWTASLGAVVCINQWAIGFVFLAHLLIYYFYVDDRRRSPYLVLLVVTAALIALTKFTFALLFAFVMLVFAIDETVRKRRMPMLPVTGAASVAVLWLLAGQRVQDFGPWFVWSLEIARGYSAAMARGGPRIEMLLFAAAAGLLCVAWFIFERQRGRRWRLLPLLGQGAVLFMAFKAAFVRHDSHAFNATLTVTALAITQLVVSWSAASRRLRLLGAVTVAVALGALSFTLDRWFDTTVIGPVARKVPRIPADVRAAARWPAYAKAYRERYRREIEAVRAATPLPPMEGTVDIYPWEQSILFAHGLRYQPRPVFQSYSAYTPMLARLNAAHLRGPRAAQNVLFDVASIDLRFPSLDDGLSWPELFVRYNIRGQYGEYALLERAPQPRELRWEPLARLTAQLDQPVTIPAGNGELIWATMEIRPTRLHSVRSFLFKAPPVWIDVETAAPAKRRFRLVPEMARAGFLLSPLVTHVSAFAMATSPDGRPYLESRSVSKLTVTVAPEDRGYFDPTISIALHRMDFPRRALGREKKLATEPVRIHDLTRQAGSYRTTGNEPRVVFALEEPQFVHAIRLTYRISNPDDDSARFRVSWKNGARDFTTNNLNGLTPVQRGPREYTQHALVGETIDRIRLEPMAQPCAFEIDDVTLILPSNEPIRAASPPPARAGIAASQ